MTETEYCEKKQNLFQRWKSKDIHKKNVFVEDGIIDFVRWNRKGNKKILFILKEAYGGKINWNLPDLFMNEWKGPKYKTWWTIAYWTYVLQQTNPTIVPLFPENKEEFDSCKEYFLSSAIINIKKSGGKSSSESDDLRRFSEEDKLLLMEQIELINPEIIICGYTFKYFNNFFDKPLTKIENTNLIFDSKGKLVVDFWHPGNQFPDILCYYALGHLYQRTLNEQYGTIK